MRNNKAKLAFEMLEMEMEVIESGELINFKGGGGEGPITWSPGGWVTAALSQATVKPVTSGIDAEGNWVIKIGDATPIPLTYTLEEVTITPTGSIKHEEEDVDGWLDIFNLPPETNNYEQNPGFSGIILPQENPWGLPTFEEFYANINPAVFNGAGNSDTEGYDYLTGYNSAGYNSSGYNSAGYNSAGFNTSGFDQQFVTLIAATGKTADAFSGVMQTVEGIARMGDFAKEATELLSNIGKYSGVVGNTLGLINDFIEVYQDGQITREELITFLTDQVVGRVLGSVPLAGGIIATLYDVTGADDLVNAQITNLVNEFFPEPVPTP